MNTAILGEKIKDLDLFIFDLDGTLVDSKKDLILAVQHAAVSVGLPLRNENEIAGYLAAGSMSLVKEVLGSDKNFELAFEHFTHHYRDHYLDNTEPYPGVLEILDALYEEKKLAVMSNKREEFCKLVLEGLGMDEYFSMIVGGDTRPHKKPHPDPLLYILEKSGVNPKKALMIGDSPQDIEAAKQAGMYSLAIGNGFTAAHLMEKTGADWFLESIDLLQKYIIE